MTYVGQSYSYYVTGGVSYSPYHVQKPKEPTIIRTQNGFSLELIGTYIRVSDKDYSILSFDRNGLERRSIMNSQYGLDKSGFLLIKTEEVL